jgi:hypothetical protein
VAGTNARLFTQMATTFAAISNSPAALKATISKSPGALSTGTVSLRDQRPFLNDTTVFSSDLSRAAVELRSALPDINPALEIGVPVLRRSVSLDQKLQGAMDALRRLAIFPGTNLAVRGLDATVTTLKPQLRFLGPYQTVCNDTNYFFNNLQEHISEEDANGFAERSLLNSTNPTQPNSVGAQGATTEANGNQGGGLQTTPPFSNRGDVEYLHGNSGAYGAAIDAHGNADCEKGQGGYVNGRLPHQYAPPESKVAISPLTPGDQGPTYTGRTHVPRGETLSSQPETGPQLRDQIP